MVEAAGIGYTEMVIIIPCILIVNMPLSWMVYVCSLCSWRKFDVMIGIASITCISMYPGTCTFVFSICQLYFDERALFMFLLLLLG